MPYTEPHMHRLLRPTLIALSAAALTGAACMLFCCSKDPWSSVGNGTINADGTTTPASLPTGQINGLMPERILIHPLSRVGVDASGRTVLICHVELHDHFEQSTRALGILRIELYGTPPSGFGSSANASSTNVANASGSAPPSADAPASAEPTIAPGPDSDGDERQELVWNVDLSNPEANALFYDDLVTRTYTLSLGNVPDWVVKWSKGIGRAEGGANSGPTLTATFAFADEDGRTRSLSTTSKLLR